MTGYGKAEAILQNGKLRVEIRSVNGKNAEISIKSSLLPKDKEIGVRKLLADTLQRGTIDMFLTWEQNEAEGAKAINFELAKAYCAQLSSLRKELGLGEPDDILATVMRMPDVIDSRKSDVITEENWALVQKAIDQALEAIDNFRSTEGKALYADVTSRVNNILGLSREIEGYEQERVAAVRDRLEKGLEDLAAKPDKERFEQELIFYIEKLDINEERVRLRQHCKYFFETIDGEPYPGKKLGFIIQEMGREINTTGSKANHAMIQKAVVRMKDELEKIREQSMNIL